VVVGLEFLLASPDMYDPVAGDATRVVLVTAMLVFLALLVAGLSWMREIVKEAAVIRRERLNGLRLVPYALSKVWLVIPVAIFQALIWTVGHLAATGLPAGFEAAPGLLITLALLAVSGGILGLVASALASTPQTAPLWVIALIVPQLILGGALVPETQQNLVGRAAAAVTPFHYGFGSLITAGEHGKDVASDPCWYLPDAERQALTDNQKQVCSCTGINIFSRCRFPGVWKEFAAILESPPPVAPKPDSGINIPIQPVLRPGETLEEYARAVNEYTLQLEIYQASTDTFTAQLKQYADDLASWQRQHSLAIGAAEGRIAAEVEKYGSILQVDLPSYWLALAGIGLLSLFFLIGVLVFKGKDVRR
jgi:hypothetical protein